MAATLEEARESYANGEISQLEFEFVLNRAIEKRSYESKAVDVVHGGPSAIQLLASIPIMILLMVFDLVILVMALGLVISIIGIIVIIEIIDDYDIGEYPFSWSFIQKVYKI